jgi:hypothetical protein
MGLNIASGNSTTSWLILPVTYFRGLITHGYSNLAFVALVGFGYIKKRERTRIPSPFSENELMNL